MTQFFIFCCFLIFVPIVKALSKKTRNDYFQKCILGLTDATKARFPKMKNGWLGVYDDMKFQKFSENHKIFSFFSA